MKVKNQNFKDLNDLELNLNLSNLKCEKTLVQVFSGLILYSEVEKIQQIIHNKNKDLIFIGTTTAGEIEGEKVFKDTILVSIIEFEETTLQSTYFNNENDFKMGVDIASTLFVNNTKAMILFIDGLKTNGSDVLDGIASINNTIPLAGGMSGDNGAFKETFIFNQDGVFDKGSVAISLNSDSLKTFTNYQLNWQPIGQFMTVTKAEKNRLYEIDGIPASDIYSKYLGNKIGEGLPHSAIEFPLLKIEEDGLEVCRTFIHKFDDGSLLTIGNLEVGDKVKLAFGNVELVMNNSKSDILSYKQFQPEAIFTYSCTARITFLQSQVTMELEPLNNIAPVAGFFTYGEIFHRNNKNSLLNISLTMIGLSEKTKDNKIELLSLDNDSKNDEKNFFDDKHFLVLDALTHLSNTVISELNDSEHKMKSLFDAAPDAITILKDGKWVDCNPATLKLFGIATKEEFINRLPSDVSPEFQPDGIASMQKVYEAVGKAVELGNYQMEWEHIRLDNSQAFTCDVTLAPMIISGEMYIYGIIRDITQRKILEKEIADSHRHTKESIEYASLIQGALIPNNQIFRHFFQDYFAIWQPKDIVGGDIYLFQELRHKDECLIMVIDCTGHGVPGAFVTMLVKAIERQIVAKIENDINIDVSPAWILKYFNKTMKKLLKQEDNDAISNAGFDGAVLYYNRQEQIIRFAGAELPLFYIKDGEFKIIKGNRQSIGYKKSDSNYEFKEHLIEAKEGMQFYLSTDGYFDQNGGNKGFPFGKKRFQKILEEYKNFSFTDQQEVLLNEMQAYQKDEERNDDVSIIGVKIGKVVKTINKVN